MRRTIWLPPVVKLDGACRLLVLLLIRASPSVSSSSSCNSTLDCPGASFKCEDGVCKDLNPYQQGCLKTLLPGWTKPRTCNSEDSPDAVAQGLCNPPDPELDYTEVRLLSQNWESSFFAVWVLQILLSELLDVPTSVETGTAVAKLNFYDASAPFQYGTNNDFDALRRANQLANNDCRLLIRDDDPYQSCGHAIPEIWPNNIGDVVTTLDEEGVIEPPQSLGALVQESWYMTRFTIDQDVTLSTYFGFHGEENRKKLAETFLQPTSWKDYCDLVSETNCSKSDGVAQSYPPEESDHTRFFAEGSYTGHFRKTDKNDCEAHPTTCTGHIANYPCSWTSWMSSQLHYLKIALESGGDGPDGGYSYSQMLELWHAANATKSNLLMIWWQTDVLYQKFAGTDAAFTRVALPDPTLECLEARREKPDRCADDYSPVKTSPLSVCDTPPQVLQKVIASGLYETANDPNIPAPLRTPAYEALSRFKITELQLNAMLVSYMQMGDPREAVCRWAVANFRQLEQFIPESYPRVVAARKDNGFDSLVYTALALSGACTFLVLLAGAMVAWQTKRRVIQVAQIEVLWLLVFGALLVSAGSIVAGLPPTDEVCLSSIWLVNAGYAIHIVPLIIKAAAINRMAHYSRKPKRVQLQVKPLVGIVATVTVAVCAYLAAWSILDPPQLKSAYELSESAPDENGKFIVTAHDYCGSQSTAWGLAAVAATALVLAFACALAMETRNLLPGYRESSSVANLILLHAFFVLVRAVLLISADVVQQPSTAVFVLRAQSFVYSLDMMSACIYYFGPKLCSSDATFSTWGGLDRSMRSDQEEDHSRSTMPSRSTRKGKGHHRQEGNAELTVRPSINVIYTPSNPTVLEREVSADSHEIETWPEEKLDKTGSDRTPGTLNSSAREETPAEVLQESVSQILMEDDQLEAPASGLLRESATSKGSDYNMSLGEPDEVFSNPLTAAADGSSTPPGEQLASSSAHVATSGELRNITVPTRLGISIEPTQDGEMLVCEVDPTSDFYGHVAAGDVIVGFGGVDVGSGGGIEPEEFVHLLKNYKTLTIRPKESQTNKLLPLLGVAEADCLV